MFDFRESLNKMLSTLNTLSDANGVIRAVLIADIYAQIRDMHSDLANQEDEWKQEKLKFEAEINDLKEELSKRGDR